MTACAKCGYDPEARVLASWSFVIGREIRSGNERINNVGGSRWTYRVMRSGWISDVSGMRLVHRIPDARGKRRVTLTRIIGYRQRRYDRDNLATGCKPVIDALVRCGLLVDDTEQHAELHFLQAKRAGLHGVVVLLEELA